MIGFSHKTLETSLLKVSANRQRHCGDTLSILCMKIVEANCANILGIETRTKLKTTAVVIFDARKIYAK